MGWKSTRRRGISGLFLGKLLPLYSSRYIFILFYV